MMVLALIILVGATALLIVASYTYGQNNSEDSMRELLSGVIPQTVTVLKGKDGAPDTAEINREELEMKDESAVMILS